MAGLDLLETPLGEIFLRGTVVYVAVAVLFRVLPKRHTANIAPNDMITLVIVGSLAADAIVGAAKAPLDLLAMMAVVVMWDYARQPGRVLLPALAARRAGHAHPADP